MKKFVMTKKDGELLKLQHFINEAFKFSRGELLVTCVALKAAQYDGTVVPKKYRLPQEAVDVLDALLNFLYWEAVL